MEGLVPCWILILRRESSLNHPAVLCLQNGLTGVPPAASASPVMAVSSGGATDRADMRASSSSHGKEERSTAPDSTGKVSSEVKPPSEVKPLKPPTLSLDALAKAKRTLQMQKELAEKMKKLPQVTHSLLCTCSYIVLLLKTLPIPLFLIASTCRILSLMLMQLNKTGAATTTTSTASAPGGLTSAQAAQATPSQLNALGMMPGVVPPNMLGMMPGMTAGMMSGMLPGMPPAGANVAALANYEAVKRAHELAMRLGFHQIPFGMPTMPTMMPTNVPEDGASKSVKAPVLRLDAQGREIDEHGHVVERSKATNVSTLKVQCLNFRFFPQGIVAVFLDNRPILPIKP